MKLIFSAVALLYTKAVEKIAFGLTAQASRFYRERPISHAMNKEVLAKLRVLAPPPSVLTGFARGELGMDAAVPSATGNGEGTKKTPGGGYRCVELPATGQL